MVVGLDLNQMLTLKFRFLYHIHVRTGLSELKILMFTDNVPTLYQNKCNKNRINYLPTQFRYL